MTRQAKPLTADEIAALNKECSIHQFDSWVWGRMAALIATIEQQREQIEKLRADKREIENAAYRKAAKRARDEIEPDDNVPDAIRLALPADAALAAVRATKKSIESGILALIQQPAQIAADLLNAVTDLVDEQVFGDAASRDKAERIIGLVLTAAIATPDRDAIRKMIGDLRWQGSALCCSAADMIEALAAQLAEAHVEGRGEYDLRRTTPPFGP